MAKIVLGMGASHGPLLATPPEQWGGRVEAGVARELLGDRWSVWVTDNRCELHRPGPGCMSATPHLKRE